MGGRGTPSGPHSPGARSGAAAFVWRPRAEPPRSAAQRPLTSGSAGRERWARPQILAGSSPLCRPPSPPLACNPRARPGTKGGGPPRGGPRGGGGWRGMLSPEGAAPSPQMGRGSPCPLSLVPLAGRCRVAERGASWCCSLWGSETPLVMPPQPRGSMGQRDSPVSPPRASFPLLVTSATHGRTRHHLCPHGRAGVGAEPRLPSRYPSGERGCGGSPQGCCGISGAHTPGWVSGL